jgi:hypothetical protein
MEGDRAMEEKPKRNCNTCNFVRGFKTCETLKNNAEYQEIIKEDIAFNTAKWKFKDNFICDNYKSRYIEYPIEVSKINRNDNKGGFRQDEVGKYVMIKPCAKECEGKTYLGIFLGDLPIGHRISYQEDNKELTVSFDNNPAILVPELNKIVYGCESWWGIIEKEEDLKEITDADIDNVWYVKALKQIENANKPEGEE